MIRRLTYVSIILFLIAMGLLTPKAHAYTMTITQKELQVMVEVLFPIRQSTAIGEVKLSSPIILLQGVSDRIGFAVNVALEMQDQYIAKGNGVIDGELDYNAERGEFYLRNPRLLKLKVDGLPPSYDSIVLSVINDLTQQELPLIVVYKLDKQSLAQAPILGTLKSVRVQKGRLLVEIGL